MNEQQFMLAREKQPNLVLAGWHFGSHKTPRCHRTRNNRTVPHLPQFTPWNVAASAPQLDILINLAPKVWAMPKKKDTSPGSGSVPQAVEEVGQ